MGATLSNFCGASASHGCHPVQIFVYLLLVMGATLGIFVVLVMGATPGDLSC